jgi:(p)ppGpp synthase/HD superfamily hydrolase
MTKENNMNNLIERAQLFATAAHGATGQKRKYSGEPYIVHPAQVVDILYSVSGTTPEMIAAGWLHDVVEDTQISLKLIQREFGGTVAELVDWLTDISKPEHGNRAARKQIDREHIAAAPPGAQTIKLADLIANTQDIVEHDKDFARIYLKEKQLLLNVLTKGDKTLHERALNQITAAQTLLSS